MTFQEKRNYVVSRFLEDHKNNEVDSFITYHDATGKLLKIYNKSSYPLGGNAEDSEIILLINLLYKILKK